MKLLKLFKRNFLKIALIIVMSGITTAATYAQGINIKPFWGGATEQIYNKHGRLVIMDTNAATLVDPVPAGLSQLSIATGVPLKLFVDTALSAFSDLTSRGKVHVIGCTSTNDGRVVFGSPNQTDPDACAKVHGEVLATNFLPAAGDINPNRNLCADVNGVVGPCAAAAPTAAFSCTGATPANSQLCFRDNLDLVQDTPKTTAWFCTDPVKCEYKCNQGYYLNLNTGLCEVPQPVNGPTGAICGTADMWGFNTAAMCVTGELVSGSIGGTSNPWGSGGQGGTTYNTTWDCATTENGITTLTNCSYTGTWEYDFTCGLCSYLNG